MITGFRDRETEKVWEGKISRRLPRDIQAIARRKLRMLNNAHKLDDLRIPPANRLEALKGKRIGANAASGSTSSGASVSSGPHPMRVMLRSWIITRTSQ